MEEMSKSFEIDVASSNVSLKLDNDGRTVWSQVKYDIYETKKRARGKN
jgi:hypothetical protein